MNTYTSKDIELEYCLTGEQHSETILFVHGLGANLSQFEQQHAYFAPYYKVLSVSLRGHGNSIVKSKQNNLSFGLDSMANDLLHLLEHLQIDKVHYVGNSMGGNIGYEILKLKPDVLLSFITYGTTGQLTTSTFVLSTMRMMYRLLPVSVIGSLSKIAGQTKSSQNTIKEMMSQVNKSTLLSIIPHLSNFSYLSTIRDSKTPALIIKGEKDKDINKELKSTLTEFEKRGHFTLYEMNGVGHFANLDNPKLFNQIVKDFIESLHPL